MRLIREEISGAGKTRLVFATNLDEIILVSGILTERIRYFPRTPATKVEYRRLHTIIREINKCLKNQEV